MMVGSRGSLTIIGQIIIPNWRRSLTNYLGHSVRRGWAYNNSARAKQSLREAVGRVTTVARRGEAAAGRAAPATGGG